MGKGSNTTTQQSTSNTATRPDNQAYDLYSKLLTQAQGVANQPFQPYTGELVAPMNAQQQAGVANINAAQPGFDAAYNMAYGAGQPITAEQIQRYQSPYTQSVVDATQRQFNNQNQAQLSTLRGQAASQGALGGNRIGVAEGQLANQQQLAQAPVIAGLNNQGYTTGLNTALSQQQAGFQGAQGVAGATQAKIGGANAQIGAGTLQQQTQQADDAARYQQYMLQLGYPFQTTQWLAGLGTGVGSQMGGTSAGSGTQTSTAPAPSPFGQVMGGLTSGAGMLGASGAFGASGWMAPMMAMLKRGGRVKGYAAGGVAGTLPEGEDTLLNQQQQLAEGVRPAQMFPKGTPELPMPEGLARTETPKGVFHHDPEQLSSGDIQGATDENRENDILNLGPYSKEDIMARVEKGEEPLALVERTPDGTEVRAAVGTQSTIEEQKEFFEKTKSPGNVIAVEPLMEALQKRQGGSPEGAPERASGGGLSGPYASQGWIPGMEITKGAGVGGIQPYQMPSMKVPDQQQSGISQQGMKDLTGFMGAAKTGMKDWNALNGELPTDAWQTNAEAGGQSASDDNPSMFYRGGAVGLAAGGAAPYEDEFGVVPTEAEYRQPPATPVAAAGPVQAQGLVPTPRPRPDIPQEEVPLPRPRPEVPQEEIPAATPAVGVAPAERNPNPDRAALKQEVLAAANQYGVPPDLALRMVTQESGLRQSAVSPKGAIGVAQLMPDTAKELGVDPNNPYENIHGGMRYLKQQYEKYGDWKLALAAYNAGPGRLDKVLAGQSSLPEETRNYVAAITGGGAPVEGGRRESASGVAPAGAPTDVSAANKPQGVAGQPKSQNGIDWSAEGKLWPALMAAGFGMMASKSPHAGVAIGEGGQAGLGMYQGLKQQELSRGMSQSRLDLEAKRFQHTADQAEKRFGLDTAKSALDERRFKSEELHKRMLEKRPFQVGTDPRTMQPIFGTADPNAPGGYRILDPKEMRPPANPQGTPTPPPATSGTKPPERVAEADKPPVWETGGAATPEEARPIRNYGENTDISASSAKSDKNTGDYIEKLVDDADRLYRQKIRQRWNTDVLDTAKDQDPEVGRLAEAILEGRQPVPKALTGKYSAQNRAAMELVRAVDPDFDEGYYAAKNKARNEATNGVAGRQAKSFNTAMGHIGQMFMLGRELDNFESGSAGVLTKPLNSVVNKYREANQDPRLNTYKTTAQAVASELAKAFRGSGGTALKEIEEWKEAIGDPRITNEQLKQGTQNLLHLLGSQLESSASTLAVGLRAPIDSQALLTAQNREMYQRIMAGQNPIIEKFDSMGKAKEALEKKRLQVGDDFAGPDGKVRKLTPDMANQLRTGAAPGAAAPVEAPKPTAAPAPAAAAKPTLPEFLAKAKEANPTASEASLIEYYHKKYGQP